MKTLSNNDSPHERLIQHLATELTPVRQLRSPSIRALGWLTMVAATAILLGLFADLPAIGRRLAAAPDMWLAVAGSAATAVLAGFAAFQLSMPDASRAWAALRCRQQFYGSPPADLAASVPGSCPEPT